MFRWRCLLVFLGALVPACADVTFTDSTLSLSNYSSTPNFSSNGSTVTITQCGNCGDPGPALQAVVTFANNPNPGVSDGGLVNNTFVYTPSTQGAIQSIAFSIDKSESVNFTFTNGGSFTTSVHPMIQQDGKYYIGTISGPNFAGGSTGFLHFSQAGLAASDFVQFDFTTGAYLTGNPNFSGDAMMFGTASLASSSNGIQFTVVDDNLTFDLVTANNTPILSVAQAVVNLDGPAGSNVPQQQTILVANGGSGSVSFTASVVSGSPQNNTTWLSVSPSSGAAAAGSPVAVTVGGNPQALGAGNYHDAIHISSNAGNIDVPVSFFAANPGSILWTRPVGVLFNTIQGVASTATQTLVVTNQGDGSVNWTAAPASGTGIPNGDFLSFGTASGQVQAANTVNLALTLNSSVASLPAGVYYELVQVTAPGSQNSPQYVTAVLNVVPPATGVQPSISPGGLPFTGAVGQAPAAQQIAVSSPRTLAIQAAASAPAGQSWLQVTPSDSTASSSTPAVFTVSIDVSGLAAGTYIGRVNLFGTGGGAVGSVNVSLIASPAFPPNVERSSARREATAAICAPSAVVLTETGIPNNFSVPAGWPAALVARMTDDCGNAIDGGSVTATFSSGDAPLALDDQGVGGQYIGTGQPSNLANTVVTLNGNAGALRPATVRLSGAVTQNQAPVLSPNGILNNLNPEVGGALAPGTVAAAFGSGLTTSQTPVSPGVSPLPKQFQDTQLIVGGSVAPLYFLSAGQLNVELPSELAPLQQYPAVGVVNGALTLPVTVSVVPLDPGLAVNPDGSVIAQDSNYNLITPTNPAHPGEAIVIYLVGMGATNPAVVSGNPAPGLTPGDSLASVVTQPVVKVGGQTAQLIYAGLTPGGIGLYQINFYIPSGAASGNLSLSVAQGNASANAATLPVQQ